MNGHIIDEKFYTFRIQAAAELFFYQNVFDTIVETNSL